jgi:hypothetical protein
MMCHVMCQSPKVKNIHVLLQKTFYFSVDFQRM